MQTEKKTNLQDKFTADDNMIGNCSPPIDHTDSDHGHHCLWRGLGCGCEAREQQDLQQAKDVPSLIASCITYRPLRR